ncbi:MAG: OsmC family protein [Betaproteobacteria bacterium]
MPAELGGNGDRVSPGWLFRAGIASCAATAIAMRAAAEGIGIEDLEATVESPTAVERALPLDVRIDVIAHWWMRSRSRCASCASAARFSSTAASPRRGAISRRAPRSPRRCSSPAPRTS